MQVFATTGSENLNKATIVEITFRSPLNIDCLSWYLPIQDGPLAWGGPALKEAVHSPAYSSFYDQYQALFQSGQEAPLEIAIDHLRAIGLQRPRSATQATRIAASLFHYLLKNNFTTRRSALFTLSQTSVSGMGYAYEKYGIEKGWDLADPFWLPNSILTSTSTHLARMGDQVKIAYSFGGNIDGLLLAVEQASYYLENRTVEEVIIVCAEQINPFQREIYTDLGGDRFFTEGASALVLSHSADLQPGQWCIRRLWAGSGPLPISVDRSVILSNPVNFSDCLTFPILLLEELSRREHFFTLAYLGKDQCYWAIQLEAHGA